MCKVLSGDACADRKWLAGCFQKDGDNRKRGTACLSFFVTLFAQGRVA